MYNQNHVNDFHIEVMRPLFREEYLGRYAPSSLVSEQVNYESSETYVPYHEKDA